MDNCLIEQRIAKKSNAHRQIHLPHFEEFEIFRNDVLIRALVKIAIHGWNNPLRPWIQAAHYPLIDIAEEGLREYYDTKNRNAVAGLRPETLLEYEVRESDRLLREKVREEAESVPRKSGRGGKRKRAASSD